jgi:hypothetical protein
MGRAPRPFCNYSPDTAMVPLACPASFKLTHYPSGVLPLSISTGPFEFVGWSLLRLERVAILIRAVLYILGMQRGRGTMRYILIIIMSACTFLVKSESCWIFWFGLRPLKACD